MGGLVFRALIRADSLTTALEVFYSTLELA